MVALKGIVCANNKIECDVFTYMIENESNYEVKAFVINEELSLKSLFHSISSDTTQFVVIILHEMNEEKLNQLNSLLPDKASIFIFNNNKQKVKSPKHFHIFSSSEINLFLKKLKEEKENNSAVKMEGISKLDINILNELSKGHTSDYICKSFLISEREMNISIQRINEYFGVEEIYEAIIKAISQNYIKI